MAESDPDRITVRCDCGAKLKVKSVAVGRKVKCPKCEQVFVVSQPEPRPEPEPIAVAPPEDDPFSGGLLDELASQEQAAQSTTDPNKRPDVATPCPSCGQQRATGAVVCIACGYNSATGKKSRAASAKKAAAAASAKRVFSAVGPFATGCIVASIGATVGAVIWAVIAVQSGYEIGYIAWGIGVLTGFGMLMGFGEADHRAGIVAALIAVVAIVGAKVMVFGYLTYPQLVEARDAIVAVGAGDNEKNERIVEHRAEYAARREGLDYDDRARERLYQEEWDKLEDLSEGEIDDAIAEIDAWEAGAKWDDPDFIRDELIYGLIDQEIVKRQEEASGGRRGFSRRDWHPLYKDKAAEVDALSAEDRLSGAKSRAQQLENDANIDLLAMHHSGLRAIHDGLPDGDDRHDTYYEEEKAKWNEASKAEVKAATSEREAWEKGAKWDDARYVTDYLIRHEVRGKIEQRQDDIAEDWEPNKDEWQTMRTEAVAAISETPEPDRRERAERAEREEREQFEAMIAEARRQFASDLTEELVGNVSSAFVSSSFGMMDVLFFVLALVSAYKIAAGMTSDD